MFRWKRDCDEAKLDFRVNTAAGKCPWSYFIDYKWSSGWVSSIKTYLTNRNEIKNNNKPAGKSHSKFACKGWTTVLIMLS